MVGIDFDFARYVNHRRGLIEQRLRDGASYSYSGEHKVRRALSSARPVLIALQAATRLWRASGRKELLKASQRANDKDFPKVYLAGQAAAQQLNLPSPTVLIRCDGKHPVPACTLGVDDDAIIALSEELVSILDTGELTAVIGRQLATIQNEHTVYATALYYLRHQSFLPVRWAAGPAIVALSAWARRADITCDRAALLATLSEPTATSALVALDRPGLSKQERQDFINALSDTAPRPGVRTAFSDHADIHHRIAALRLFTKTQLYQRASGASDKGPTTEEVDRQVAELIKVFS